MDHHAQSGTEHAEQRLAEARELLRQSQAEAERLRHQLQSAQRHAAGLSERRRAAEAQTQTAARNNRRMVELLEATRAEITTLKENLDAVTHPPFTFATLEAVHALLGLARGSGRRAERPAAARDGLPTARRRPPHPRRPGAAGRVQLLSLIHISEPTRPY